jgi:hypothetical protein
MRPLVLPLACAMFAWTGDWTRTPAAMTPPEVTNPRDASPVAVPETVPASPGSCEDLRTRFYALVDSSRACSRDEECDCVARIDVSGGGLLGVQTSVSRKLRALTRSYGKRGCPISCRSSSAPKCQPHCAGGLCSPLKTG